MERPPIPGGGGSNKPSNNSRRRNQNNKRRKERKPAGTKGPPPTPQVKVVIRNIQSAETYGTAKQIIEGILTALVERANDKLTAKLVLDATNLNQLLQDEHTVLIARQEWEEGLLQSSNNDDDDDDDEDDEETKAADDDAARGEGKTDEKEQEQGDTPIELEPLVKTMAQVLIPAIQNLKISDSSVPGIATTVLYVVPPKKTRRRGEKPGCVYMLLTAPVLDIQAPAVVAATAADTGFETMAPIPAPAIDYTQQVTHRRNLLLTAVEAMTQLAAQDAKGKQEWAACVVEESLNSKAWKTNLDTTRMPGTVEETSDYQQFLLDDKKTKEERLARPKPAPGGGLALALAAAENGQPMAALVLHLRAKHEEENKRKKAKRKVTGKQKLKGGGAKDQDGGGAKQQDGSKKKKKSRNRLTNKGGKGTKASGAPAATSAWGKG